MTIKGIPELFYLVVVQIKVLQIDQGTEICLIHDSDEVLAKAELLQSARKARKVERCAGFYATVSDVKLLSSRRK